MGVPLYKIKDIRLLYGENPWPADPIRFGEYVDFLLYFFFKIKIIKRFISDFISFILAIVEN